MYGSSPQAFVPPIPPDQTSSAESSPILRNGAGLPPEGGHRGGPGGPGGYPGFPGYGEYPDYDPKEDMGHYMMQRWAAPARRPGANKDGAAPNAKGGAAPPSMVPRGYYGGAAGYGFAPAPPATPGPTYGYGFSPYPQPSPYPYQTPGGYPFGMYGGQGMMPPQQFMTPFMTPIPTPGVLDPPVGAPIPGAPHHMPHAAGGMGAHNIVRPGGADSETSVGKWLPGTEYGPVLDPLSFSVLRPPAVELHPLLRPIPETRDNADPHLVFDLLFPPNTIHLSNERPTKSWSKGRSAPAVFPRVKLMRVITKYTPWIVQVTSDGPNGVTVYDVIQAIHDSFRINASQQDDWERADQATKAEILMAYKWNRSTEPGAPGGVMSDALLRGDFLMERTQYAGLRLASPELCEEKLDVKFMPATFELLLHTR